jgi:hypothetical protein
MHKTMFECFNGNHTFAAVRQGWRQQDAAATERDVCPDKGARKVEIWFAAHHSCMRLAANCILP